MQLDIEEIETIKVDIDKYEGQKIFYHDLYEKSDGVSNRITITIKGRVYTELFQLGNERHYHDLILTSTELERRNVNINVNDRS